MPNNIWLYLSTKLPSLFLITTFSLGISHSSVSAGAPIVGGLSLSGLGEFFGRTSGPCAELGYVKFWLELCDRAPIPMHNKVH